MNPFSLLFLVLTLAGLGYYIKRQPANQRSRSLLTILAAAALFLLIYLAFTRRLYILGVALAFLLPFAKRLLPLLLRGLPFYMAWRKRKQTTQPPPNNQSKVQTNVLEMVLDHDSGTMNGRVLQGPMEGRDLADLGDEDFIELLKYCREQDRESARLLETYLDRRFGESWRRDDPGTTDENTEPPESNGPLTDAEAYDILGLKPGASREEIVQAHRRLMQRMHPDRGGSPYLAARLNAARSHLLKD